MSLPEPISTARSRLIIIAAVLARRGQPYPALAIKDIADDLTRAFCDHPSTREHLTMSGVQALCTTCGEVRP